MPERLSTNRSVDRRRNCADLEKRPPSKDEFRRIVDEYPDHGTVLDSHSFESFGEPSNLSSILSVGPAAIFEQEGLIVFVLAVRLMDNVIKRPIVLSVDLA